MCVASDVLWCVVKSSVMTDGTSGSHNNEVHAGRADIVSAVGTNAFNMYIEMYLYSSQCMADRRKDRDNHTFTSAEY